MGIRSSPKTNPSQNIQMVFCFEGQPAIQPIICVSFQLDWKLNKGHADAGEQDS